MWKTFLEGLREWSRTRIKSLTRRFERSIERTITEDTIAPQATVAAGVVLAFLFGIFIFILLAIFVWAHWMTFVLSMIMAGKIVFQNNLTKVEIQHSGVIKFFGKRYRGHTLEEGDHWLPSEPIVSIESVDRREKTLKIEPEKLIAAGFEDGDQGDEREQEYHRKLTKMLGEDVVLMAEIVVDTTVQYIITKPIKFLDIDLGVMKEALHDRVIAVQRRVASRRNPLSLIKDTGTLREAVKNDLDGEDMVIEGEVVETRPDDETVLEPTQSSESTEESWGMKITRINVTNIRFADSRIQEAYESILRESLETVSETTEARNLVKNANMIADNVRGGMSGRDAVIAFQAERGKLERIEISGGDEGRKVTQGESIAAALLSMSKRGSPNNG